MKFLIILTTLILTLNSAMAQNYNNSYQGKQEVMVEVQEIVDFQLVCGNAVSNDFGNKYLLKDAMRDVNKKIKKIKNVVNVSQPAIGMHNVYVVNVCVTVKTMKVIKKTLMADRTKINTKIR